MFNLIFINQQSTAAQQTTLPKIELRTLNYKTTTLTKLSKPSLLLFFLPQSPTCQQQLDVLSTIKQHNDLQINITAIAIGNLAPKKLQQLKTEKNIQFDFLIDSRAELTEKLKISTIPTLVFYHPQQQLKFTEGLSPEKDLLNLINQHLIVNN
ncbi:MAG: peroxiredoxin family protein [Bacillota bacterium]